MMKLARSKLLSLNTFKPASWIIPIAISPDVRTPALSCSLTYVYVLTLFEDCLQATWHSAIATLLGITETAPKLELRKNI